MIKIFFIALLIPTILVATTVEPSPVDKDVQDRIAYIQNHFDTTAFGSKSWQYGWSTLYGAIILADIDTYNRSDDEVKRYDMVVDLILTGSGFGDLMLYPLPSYNAGQKLNSFEALTEDAFTEKLRYAEMLLEQSAAEERRRTALETHLLSTASALIGGAAIAAKEARYKEGTLYALSVIISTQIKIAMTPTASVDAYASYKNRFSQKPQPRYEPDYEVRLLTLPAYMALVISF